MCVQLGKGKRNSIVILESYTAGTGYLSLSATSTECIKNCRRRDILLLIRTLSEESHTHTHARAYMHIYFYICMCVEFRVKKLIHVIEH